MSAVINPSQSRIGLILFVILNVYPLFGMGVDLIAPSLPAITQDLQISSLISKNLISIYLLGYIVGNFFTGFLSDSLGRRRFIILGFLLFVISSLLPAFIPTSTILLVMRFLQGLSLGIAAVGASAVITDIVMDKKKIIWISSLRATMWGIGPIIGPLIGGYLQYYFNWQACFVFFAIYGLVCLIAIVLVVPETHRNRQAINLSVIKGNFNVLINNGLFMGLVFLMGTQYSLLIVFNTLGPFIIQNHLGYSSIDFGHMALGLGIVFLLGTQICRFLIKHIAVEKVILYAIPLSFLSAALGLITSLLMQVNIVLILVNSLFMFFGCGIIYPACMGKALALFRHLGGSSAAVMNLVNVLITSLAAFLASFVNTANMSSLSVSYFILMAFCGLCFYMKVRSKNSEDVKVL